MEKPKDPREFFANEQTFLAWLRTGIAIMAFGFVVVKFSLFIRQLSILSPQSQQILAEHHQPRGYSNWIGFFILLIGASVIPLAYLRFVQVNRQLDQHKYSEKHSLPIIITLMTILIAIALLIYVIGVAL